jgi:hypothetical protein
MVRVSGHDAGGLGHGIGGEQPRAVVLLDRGNGSWRMEQIEWSAHWRSLRMEKRE